MAIYDTGTASLAANGQVTGVGTQWTMPLTLIRVGATLVFKTEPVQIYTISEITSDTSMAVYNPNGETVPAGTGYAILAHDGISVQGLAQDVAETLRYYQSRETEVADAVDAFNDFDAADFDSKVNQVNTQHGDVVSIGAQVSADASQVSLDKDSAAASALTASNDKDAAAVSAQQAADYAASLDSENLLRKDLNFSDVEDKATARSNLDVYSKSEVDNISYSNFPDASHYKNYLEDSGNVNIECFGDSTMWGSTSLNSTVQNAVNPPAVLQRTLDILYGSGRATVTNKAIPGTALFSMLNGTDGSGSTFEAKMQESTANVVYCNHAQNDCNSLLRTVLQYKADLVTFVNICRKYGKVPVLVTPNLTVVLDGITEQVTKRLPAFVDAMRETAKEMGVDMVDNHYYTVKASRYISLYDIAPDGVHPGTDIYYMCGSNLAMPLVAHRVLYKPGDVTGLSNVRYRDNIISGRNFSNADNIFSKQLSWNAIEGQTGVWFPFVLDNPTDDTVISICGLQWGGGGKTIIGYKDSLDNARLSGTIDQYRVDTTDESAYFIPNTCRLLPGLHVINILNHSLAGGETSSFSGIKLIKRQETGAGYPQNAGFDAARLIHVNDVIIKDVYVSGGVGEGGVLFLLRDARTATQQSLTISNSEGTITFGMANGPSATLGSGLQSGVYTITVELNSDRTVTVRMGALIASTSPASMPLSTSFVSTPGVYSVRKS